jgi:hypothetical protein
MEQAGLQEKPAHADGEEDFRVLPLGEIRLEVSELFVEATSAVLLQRRLLGDIWGLLSSALAPGEP